MNRIPDENSTAGFVLWAIVFGVLSVVILLGMAAHA